MLMRMIRSILWNFYMNHLGTTKQNLRAFIIDPQTHLNMLLLNGGPNNMSASQFADMVTYWYSSNGKVALDKAIEEHLSQCPPETQMVDIHEAAFRSTFGEEYYGRCQGMGTGVTAIQVYPELSRRTQSTGPGQRKSNESEEISNLKSQMAIMQTTVDFLVDALSLQGFRDDHSGT